MGKQRKNKMDMVNNSKQNCVSDDKGIQLLHNKESVFTNSR